MSEKEISNAFRTFMTEAPNQASAWMRTVRELDSANALDTKTGELAYIAVLAAVRLESGIPFHVKRAKEFGATREEVISAVLTGLPAVGHIVVQVLPVALNAYDGDE
jgi:alkylhydroperoxidase/carboxymuconolactone decarboxylase family protein YurZ